MLHFCFLLLGLGCAELGTKIRQRFSPFPARCTPFTQPRVFRSVSRGLAPGNLPNPPDFLDPLPVLLSLGSPIEPLRLGPISPNLSRGSRDPEFSSETLPTLRDPHWVSSNHFLPRRGLPAPQTALYAHFSVLNSHFSILGFRPSMLGPRASILVSTPNFRPTAHRHHHSIIFIFNEQAGGSRHHLTVSVDNI